METKLDYLFRAEPAMTLQCRSRTWATIAEAFAAVGRRDTAVRPDEGTTTQRGVVVDRPWPMTQRQDHERRAPPITLVSISKARFRGRESASDSTRFANLRRVGLTEQVQRRLRRREFLFGRAQQLARQFYRKGAVKRAIRLPGNCIASPCCLTAPSHVAAKTSAR
jgi:hypothetical protein